jgi:hypothetical protein
MSTPSFPWRSSIQTYVQIARMHLAVHFAVLSGERRTLDIFFQTIRVGLVVVGLMLYFSEKGLTN